MTTPKMSARLRAKLGTLSIAPEHEELLRTFLTGFVAFDTAKGQAMFDACTACVEAMRALEALGYDGDALRVSAIAVRSQIRRANYASGVTRFRSGRGSSKNSRTSPEEFPMSDADQTRDRLAEIRARLFVERTGDEFVAHAPADMAWLLEECERLGLALGDAAREINCAGPVAHRIRVLREELSADITRLSEECERLRGDSEAVDEWEAIYTREYGVGYRELRRRAKAVERGEGISHDEAMQRIIHDLRI